MLEFKKGKATFKVVCIKGKGSFENFNIDVPNQAKLFLERVDEINHRSGIEIALFERKRDANHLEGVFYVGMIVHDSPAVIPDGMEYLEWTNNYVTLRGNIDNISTLHNNLLKWSDNHSYKMDFNSLIVETYHPLENGGEDVEVYLPIQLNH